MPSGLGSSVLDVMRGRLGITAMFVSYGTTMPKKIFITATTVGFAERVGALVKTSSIARYVLYGYKIYDIR